MLMDSAQIWVISMGKYALLARGWKDRGPMPCQGSARAIPTGYIYQAVILSCQMNSSWRDPEQFLESRRCWHRWRQQNAKKRAFHIRRLFTQKGAHLHSRASERETERGDDSFSTNHCIQFLADADGSAAVTSNRGWSDSTGVYIHG